ncbi:hypothetical protein SMACR_09385 [Sordaria macrospora]|uniref:WGS project CABT00000000 data, contig 2.88 n=2 Tax=Sordaria macrospora TaxID=5147 RepID=F7WBX6_SORMK|nr:uncharacterized protein SMAC_09385 [Sordaria macrospora k-hell]KAA8628262.1 hypothetical protein SMACR_09385 [Sordaria macrospora]WPJ63270.1 hypothetical protein SMAC4_09385 [Sordaria macrospora]CCC14506.1 unnamed protein product [Sordaria macrospora k-hell]
MEIQNPIRSPLALGPTEKEQASFDALLELCRSRGYLDHPVSLSNEDVRDGLNDETTFLSAPQSMQQPRTTLSASMTLKIPRAWYVRPDPATLYQDEQMSNKMKKILETNGRESEAKLILLNLRLPQYPHWSGRRDKRGLPICIFDIASLDTVTTTSYGKDRRDGETIDIENIPTQYGGRLNIKPVDFATQLCPVIAQAIKWEGTLRGEIPAGPIKFVVDEQGGRSIVAVGTATGGKMRKELVARIP